METTIEKIQSLYKKRNTPLVDQIMIGCLLCKLKPILHRGFAKLVEQKFQFSLRRAQHYMNLYKSGGKGYESCGSYNNVIFHSSKPTKVVYFIQAQSEYYMGPIKIGHTKKLRQRFVAMQMFNFHDLHVLKLLSGGRQEETDLHHKFAKDRIKGEWFRPSPELLEYINSLQEEEQLTLLKQEVMSIKNIFT